MTSKCADMTVLTSFSVARALSPPELLAPQLQFKVTIMAVNDMGAPVPGANIAFAPGGLGDNLSATGNVQKIADKRGTAEFGGVTQHSSYSFGAIKEGHYPSSGLQGEFLSTTNGHWAPWA